MSAPEGISAATLRELARTSADFARMARVSQLALQAKDKTWLATQASAVAGELADGHSIAALQLDQAACRLLRGEVA